MTTTELSTEGSAEHIGAMAPLTAAGLRALAADAGSGTLRAHTDLLAEALVSVTDTKPPLSIGEVADVVGVSVHTLRWYERIGLVDVPRTAGGHRSYDVDAIGRVIFLTRLRLTGMPITEIQEYVSLVASGPETVSVRRTMLERHREALRRRMDELEFSLAVLDHKIASYCCDPTDAPHEEATA